MNVEFATLVISSVLDNLDTGMLCLYLPGAGV
jgi:hypothetical protein